VTFFEQFYWYWIRKFKKHLHLPIDAL